VLYANFVSLQYFDTVGWESARAFKPAKNVGTSQSVKTLKAKVMTKATGNQLRYFVLSLKL